MFSFDIVCIYMVRFLSVYSYNICSMPCQCVELDLTSSQCVFKNIYVYICKVYFVFYIAFASGLIIIGTNREYEQEQATFVATMRHDC